MLFIVFVVIAVAAVTASVLINRPIGSSAATVTAVIAIVGAAATGFFAPNLLMGDRANPTTSTETFALQSLGGSAANSPVYTATTAHGASQGEISFMYDDHGTVRQTTSAPQLVSVVDDASQPRVEVRHTKVSHSWLTPFERNGYDQYVLHVPAGQKPTN